MPNEEVNNRRLHRQDIFESGFGVLEEGSNDIPLIEVQLPIESATLDDFEDTFNDLQRGREVIQNNHNNRLNNFREFFTEDFSLPISSSNRLVDIMPVEDLDIVRDLSRIENRIQNQGGSTFADYLTGTIQVRNAILALYSTSRYEYLEHSRYHTKSIDLNYNITLAEDPKIKLSVKECINIPKLGWFRKDDKRLISDYIYKDNFIILDEKYKTTYTKVYTDIDDKGNLVCNNTYTTTYPNKDKIYEKIVYFLPEIYVVKTGKIEYIELSLLEDRLFKEKYIERIKDGVFYLRTDLSSEDLIEFKERPYKFVYRKYRDEIGEFNKSIKNIPNTFINTLDKKYYFGVEIETISGRLPKYLDNFLFYSAVHDGSLRDPETGETYGGEYITDVLQGDLGLQQLKKLCYELTKRCLVDKRCGNHVHLSGVNFTKENIILMYYLYYNIQDEIFSMMPKSRRKNEYCRKLDNLSINISNIHPKQLNRNYYIDKYYSEIIMFLSKKDFSSRYVNKKKDHPKGFKCAYDHSASRYCWVNFVPAVFNTRGNSIYTIEFRPMQASTSYRKIKNWLLICFSLVDIVENYKQEIYDKTYLNLADVLNICYPKDSEKLINYVNERKLKFSEIHLTNQNKDMTKVENDDYQENELDNDFKLKNL